jgi:predicted MFS family arabinose efflux permease
MSSRYLILLLAWLGWVFDIEETAIFNLAKGPMLIQMMGAAEYRVHGVGVEARIQSGFLLGWSIGGLIFGVLADRWGRSKTLVVTVLVYCAFTGLTALCHSPEQVMVARFLTALGIGGEWAAGASLVAESFADRQRPMAAAALQTAAAFGPVFAALTNLALANQPWQWLFVAGILPAVFCVMARYGVHDPIRGASGFTVSAKEVLTSRTFIRNAAAAMIVGAVGISGAGTATFWRPNLVRAVSEGMKPTQIVARTSTVEMVSHIGTLAGVFAAPWLCRRLGRKKTIAGFFVLAPVSVYLSVGGGASYERLLALMPLVNFFAIGVSAAFVLYFPELFPTQLRATGSGLAYNVGRFLSIPVPLFTAWTIQRFGNSASTGVVLSGSVYVLGLAALVFLPETKDLPLERAIPLNP